MNRRLLRGLFYLVLLGGAITFIYPFLWMVLGTIKPEIEITTLRLLPSRVVFDSYQAVFSKIPIARAFLNSLLVASLVTSSVLVFSSLTGYALSRLTFKGKELLFSLVLFTMMMPFQITLIPMYILMVKFHWVDTYQALVVPGMVSAFGILIFRQAFKAIPGDLIDSARLDGYAEVEILFRIVWPLSKPALITVGLITFVNTWNDVLWPIIVIRDQTMMTMPQMVALFTVGGQAEAQIGNILAAATLLAIPMVAAYLLFQRYFIESMATSGLKG